MSSLGNDSPVPQLPLLGTATGPRPERKPDIFSPKPSQQAGGVSEKANLPEKAHASQDDNELTPAPPLLGHTTTGTSRPKTVSPGNTSPSTQHGGAPSQPHARRFLNAAEWARVAHGLGAILDDKEDHRVARPACWYWPPKGIPDGLYREVVVQRSKYGLAFVLLGAAHWALMVVQVMVGAVLTALGSLELRENTVITILAAANTVGAGLLGLMHNSGLPDRYRMDQAQFASVEGFIRSILDTGIVDAEQSIEDVLTECYSRFASAKATVLSNKPDVYSNPIPSHPRLVNLGQCLDPAAHNRMEHT